MPFPASSFDAVISVVSLQFVESYRQMLEKSASVLRPGGRIVVMLLNPESVFFKEKLRDSDSYVRRIRHASIPDIEEAMAENFQVRAEYFMGVKRGELFKSRDPDYAALYVLSGTKLPAGAGNEES
jgi:ubiquinone/menaquinone biosynthesis C-methylase UbiE